MLKREELIKTPEFWQEIISNRLWRAAGEQAPGQRIDANQCDKLAAGIVDPGFIKAIDELTKLPKTPITYRAKIKVLRQNRQEKRDGFEVRINETLTLLEDLGACIMTPVEITVNGTIGGTTPGDRHMAVINMTVPVDVQDQLNNALAKKPQ